MIWCMEVRYSLLYYVLLVALIGMGVMASDDGFFSAVKAIEK